MDILPTLLEEWKSIPKEEVKAPPAEDHLSVYFVNTILSKSDALRREQYFKTTAGKRVLRLMLQESLSVIMACDLT